MKKILAEFLGTALLVFFGTGSVVVDEVLPGAIGHVGISICFGLIVMILILALGDLSGAHLNPAVSIAFASAGLFKWSSLPGYIVAQVAGAIAASALLKYLFPASVYLGVTLPSGSGWQSFILEAILSFLLMLVIFRMSTGSREQGLMAGMTIGSVILLEAMFGGPVSGASMNPARSIGPAVISNHLSFLWIYVTAPVAGMLIATPVYHYFKN